MWITNFFQGLRYFKSERVVLRQSVEPASVPREAETNKPNARPVDHLRFAYHDSAKFDFLIRLRVGQVFRNTTLSPSATISSIHCSPFLYPGGVGRGTGVGRGLSVGVDLGVGVGVAVGLGVSVGVGVGLGVGVGVGVGVA